jgi:hypothetical protein
MAALARSVVSGAAGALGSATAGKIPIKMPVSSAKVAA